MYEYRICCDLLLTAVELVAEWQSRRGECCGHCPVRRCPTIATRLQRVCAGPQAERVSVCLLCVVLAMLWAPSLTASTCIVFPRVSGGVLIDVSDLGRRTPRRALSPLVQSDESPGRSRGPCHVTQPSRRSNGWKAPSSDIHVHRSYHHRQHYKCKGTAGGEQVRYV